MSTEIIPSGQQNPQQTVFIQKENSSNGIGTAGFVLALIALFLGWIPILGWMLWILGLIFSFIGVFKKPYGLAIAGLVISFLSIFILIFIFGAFLLALS